MIRLPLLLLPLLMIQAAPEYPKMGPDIFDTQTDGKELIAAALKQAQSEHKRVLVDMGANWCIWCRRLDHTFETDPAVSAELKSHFVLVLIDVNHRHDPHRNSEVIAQYHNPVRFGLPVLVVLDASGRQLTTEDSGNLEDGPGHSPQKIVAFLRQWEF
ncbi:MAG TPA: thioredoxin family protein [Opitutaceae bacterium]|jgi:thiol:disulfide interchange protein